MNNSRLDISGKLVDQVNKVVEDRRQAGEKVSKNQVVAEAITLYTEVNSPDLKLAAYTREHFPLGDSTREVEDWYEQFVGASGT